MDRGQGQDEVPAALNDLDPRRAHRATHDPRLLDTIDDAITIADDKRRGVVDLAESGAQIEPADHVETTPVERADHVSTVERLETRDRFSFASLTEEQMRGQNLTAEPP